ncbi:MAG: alkaline phosphatase PafA [Flavipsychrobacter sp.]
MKYLGWFVVFVLLVSPVFAQKTKQVERPKLVVGLVVDQMRWDYLYRYYDRYSDKGFKRLMNKGYACQNTIINYIPTATGPGHASVYTGSVPAIHGIASNSWIEVKTGKQWYCVEDPSVTSVGGSDKAGKMSPRNLNTTTVGDELRLSTNKRSKVFGVGIKDRGSILPAGHTANGAFWFDDSTGNFMTSSFYMEALPDWLNQFNNKRLADKYIKQPWQLLYDKATYTNSLPDDNAYEGTFLMEKSPIFPHKLYEGKQSNYKFLRYMPAGNTITLDLAEACIIGEQLGKDDNTDMLCITLSSTDYAGHNYAPDAMEMEDMFLRLDLDIATFLDKLDDLVGAGNYTIFLTADHGAVRNSMYLNSLKIPSGNKLEYNSSVELNHFLVEQFKVAGLVKAISSYQVYYNEEKIKANQLDRAKVKEATVAYLLEHEGVATIIDLEELDALTIPEPIRTMIVNSHYPKRNGALLVLLRPGWYSGYGKTGTTHGSWAPYDSHVPLLWYGWGINKGVSYKTVNITDIAATLSSLLHIQMPNGNVGQVIEGVIEN